MKNSPALGRFSKEPPISYLVLTTFAEKILFFKKFGEKRNSLEKVVAFG